jgi:hypothetical protein
MPSGADILTDSMTSHPHELSTCRHALRQARGRPVPYAQLMFAAKQVNSCNEAAHGTGKSSNGKLACASSIAWRRASRDEVATNGTLGQAESERDEAGWQLPTGHPVAIEAVRNLRILAIYLSVWATNLILGIPTLNEGVSRVLRCAGRCGGLHGALLRDGGAEGPVG